MMLSSILAATLSLALAAPNTLTPEEKAAGWELLWDGRTTAGWTGVKSRCKAFPEHGWKIANGVLSVVPRKEIGPDGKEIVLSDAEAQLGGGGDIVTTRQFGDFEFKTDFRLWPGANSGIKYFYDVEVNKDPSNGYGTSTEFQLLDMTGRAVDQMPPADHLTGSLYALKAADAKGVYRPGEWNTLRILSKGAHVEHWLNGVKLLDYERGSADFRARVAKSKYATWGGKEGVAWGEAPRGRILLQDHSCQAAFRNIKIREIKARPAVELQMRDGLARTFARLERGERTTVAYIGGSITSGEDCWRTKTTEWLRQHYPETEIVEVNAAIGGTGSEVGVFRYDNDVLSKKPDLVFIEFACNDTDSPAATIRKSMEGMVRKTWRANPETDIVFTYVITSYMTNDYCRGVYHKAAAVHEEIAEFYGIPSVCFGLRVADLCRKGVIEMRGLNLEAEARKRGAKLVFPEQGEWTGQPLPESERPIFAMDGIHPTDGGQRLYCNILTDSLEKMCACRALADHAARLEKGPLHPENYEKAQTVRVTNEMLTGDWSDYSAECSPRVTPIAEKVLCRAPQLKWCQKPGSKLNFRFRGTSCALYHLLGPDCGKLVVRIDGKVVGRPVNLFDHYCHSYRLSRYSLWSGPEGTHEVEAELLAEEPDRRQLSRPRAAFWTDAELAKPKYRGTTFFLAGLMIDGEIVR